MDTYGFSAIVPKGPNCEHLFTSMYRGICRMITGEEQVGSMQQPAAPPLSADTRGLADPMCGTLRAVECRGSPGSGHAAPRSLLRAGWVVGGWGWGRREMVLGGGTGSWEERHR